MVSERMRALGGARDEADATSTAVDAPDAGTAPDPDAPTDAARLHRFEERVLRAAHPVAYPLLRRERRPVRRLPGLGVLVTDTELLRAVLLDHEHFDKTGPGSPADLWTPVLGPSVLLNMEGEAHGRLRRRLAPLFAPRAVEELAAEGLAPVLTEARERLAQGGEIDVVALARAGASGLIASLAGIDGDVLDDTLFARISRVTAMVSLARPRFTERQAAVARAIIGEVTATAADAYRAGDESTVPGRMRALGLSEEEALGAVGAFVLTGTETLVAFIPRLVAMLVDSGWGERVRADRGLLDDVVHEGLRVATPSPVMLRSTRAATAIGGVSVRPGDRIVLATFLANRQPGGFDPASGRATGQKQLWFGAGAHFCLGAPLAHAQIRLVVSALLDGADGAGGPLRIEHRRISRRTLIPGYRLLAVRAG